MDTSHNRNKDGKDEWLTPPAILRALGPFDLDPCAPAQRPWPMAKRHYTKRENGLTKPWEGRVWCNPPYGNETELWLDKCARHGNCIALTFARTETVFFHELIWSKAYGVFFFLGRLYFYHRNGERAKHNAGAPSVLVAYNRANVAAIERAKLPGKLIRIK